MCEVFIRKFTYHFLFEINNSINVNPFRDDKWVDPFYGSTNNPFRDDRWVAKVFLFRYNYQRQENKA
jgi:hypothetical protein